MFGPCFDAFVLAVVSLTIVSNYRNKQVYCHVFVMLSYLDQEILPYILNGTYSYVPDFVGIRSRVD